jgi:hypothetical protein
VHRRGFLEGCAILDKPSYLTSSYKRGGSGRPGLSKWVGAMERFLMLMTVVLLLAMALVFAQQHASVLHGAP